MTHFKSVRDDRNTGHVNVANSSFRDPSVTVMHLMAYMKSLSEGFVIKLIIQISH